MTAIHFQEKKKMVVYSKNSYDYQDGGRILKAARKQHYIMFHVPIMSLNDELKSEPGMKTKKEEDEDDAKFRSLKFTMDDADRDSKTYLVKIRKYDEFFSSNAGGMRIGCLFE
jgi:hypothetical protein